jgi:D-alanyl-lipoteichoic acid acyltransferase DltB (MBOAT superfamily)
VRVDSLQFIGLAAVLVTLLRTLRREHARVAYALISAAVYMRLAPSWPSAALSALFVLWPFAYLRYAKPRPAWSIAALIGVQTLLLLWARRYLALVPGLEHTPLVTQAVAIVGISYIILRQIELVLWVDAEPDTRVSLCDYLGFTIGVFTLLAGPILSYRQFQEGFAFDRSRESPRSIALAANRIVNGYFKLSLIGPILYDLSSLPTLHAADASLGARALFFYVYPLYIYFNFAGYCDVVIGAGMLGRFAIPENFDHPYLATNIQNYWQRWHLTFSHWIRNHLFFPLVRALRGSRVSGVRALTMPAAVMITFVLVGLWHGTGAGFLVFGLLHGLAVLAVVPYTRLLDRALGERARQRYESSPVIRTARRVVCYHYLCFTMLFFERPLGEVLALLR